MKKNMKTHQNCNSRSYNIISFIKISVAVSILIILTFIIRTTVLGIIN